MGLRRVSWVLPFLLLLPAAVAGASEDLLPLTEGTRWTYRVTGPDGKAADYTYRVYGPAWQKMADGKTCQRIVWEDRASGREFGYENWSVRADGIYRYANDGKAGACGSAPDRKRAPVPVLRLPARRGDSWTWKVGAVEWTALVESTDERVVVPAGTYAAVRVLLESGDKRERLWFASGVGIVKREMGELRSELVRSRIVRGPGVGFAFEDEDAELSRQDWKPFGRPFTVVVRRTLGVEGRTWITVGVSGDGRTFQQTQVRTQPPKLVLKEHSISWDGGPTLTLTEQPESVLVDGNHYRLAKETSGYYFHLLGADGSLHKTHVKYGMEQRLEPVPPPASLKLPETRER